MSFDWRRYCDLADALVQSAGSMEDIELREAMCRSAVSRAYYGLFNVWFRRFALQWSAEESVGAVGGADKHWWTITRFKSYANPGASKSQLEDFRKVATDLDRLRRYRNDADYEDNLGVDPMRRANTSAKTARRSLERLEKY